VTTMAEGRLVRVNATPFMQVFGPSLERNVWASPVPIRGMLGVAERDAAALYRTLDPASEGAPLEAAFPVGALFIHETVNREEGHTVQVKRDDYADERGRPWWFAKVYDDGSYDLNDCSPCSGCHNEGSRPNSEGLFGVPRHAL